MSHGTVLRDDVRNLLIRERRPQIGSLLSIISHGGPGLVEQLMPHEQSGPQGPSGVARRGLDPDIFERAFPEQPTIGHAIQGHTAGQAEPPLTCVIMHVPGHLQQDLFRYFLNGSGQVHVAL